MVTETIIMRLVSLGKSKEVAHEEIRVLPYQASDVAKKEGGKNDLIERIKQTDFFFFAPVKDQIDDMLGLKNFTDARNR